MKVYITPFILIFQIGMSMAYDNNESSFRTFYSDFNLARVNNDTVFFASMFPPNHNLLKTLPDYYVPFMAITLDDFIKQYRTPYALRTGEVGTVEYLDNKTLIAEIYYPELGEKKLSTETYTFENGFWRTYSSQQIIDFMAAYQNAKTRIIYTLNASLSTADSTQLEIDISGQAYVHVGRQLDKNINLSQPGHSHSSSGQLFFLARDSEKTLHIRITCKSSGNFSFNYGIYEVDKEIGPIDLFKLAEQGTKVASMDDFGIKYHLPYSDFLGVYELFMEEGEVNDIEIKLH